MLSLYQNRSKPYGTVLWYLIKMYPHSVQKACVGLGRGTHVYHTNSNGFRTIKVKTTDKTKHWLIAEVMKM